MGSREISVALAFMAAVFLNAAFWALNNIPKNAGPDITKPLASFSFAPFRGNQSPLTKNYPSPKEIEADMRLLQDKSKRIRTYTSREGMEVVPELARKYGLKVIHSAWLGGKETTNEAEIEALIKSANQYPDVIESVIVGNEVLLRRDLLPAQLVANIRKVKENIKQPVSYADVWAFWLKHPEVAEAVDIITIHILPYWEDEPVHIDETPAYILKTFKMMQERFPNKRFLIGEAGWPTMGRSRGPAVPSVVNAAKFVRELAYLADKNGIDYNVVEAFDQNWKSKLEGTVGANWGWIDDSRHFKFSMTGKVVEDANWPMLFVTSLVLGMIAGTFFFEKWGGLSNNQLIGFFLFAQALAVMFVKAGYLGFIASYTWHSLLIFAIWQILIGIYAMMILEASLTILNNKKEEVPEGERRMFVIFALSAIIVGLLIAFDGRYRDIPVTQFLIPVLGPLVLVILGQDYSGFDWKKGLTLAILLTALANIWGEGWAIVGEDFSKNYPTRDAQIPLIIKAMFSNIEVLVWVFMLMIWAWASNLRYRFKENITQAE